MKTWVESSLSSLYLSFSFLSLLKVKTKHNNHAFPTEGGGVPGIWGCETELLRVSWEMQRVNYSSFSAELAQRLLASQERLSLQLAPWLPDVTLDCAPLQKVGKWPLLKKSPLALWGRWRRKKCSFEEITGIQWLPLFGPYTRGPSLELPGTNSPRGGRSSQAPKSPQVYAALFYLSTLSDYCKGKPCRKLCSLKLKVGIYYSCLGLQGGSDLLWDLSPRRAQNLAEGVQFIERQWKWSRSVVSDSLWPHGLYPTTLLCSWDFPGKSTGVGYHFLLQRIFPIQGLNPGLPHCRQTLYRPSHQWTCK